MSGGPKRVVLAVIDSLKPDVLERAIAEDRAPVLSALVDRGVLIRDCISDFPSVTPVCSASIATGTRPHEHHIPSMNWFHRGEGRYVEYGSSFQATRAFGIVRSLYDTVYNMNMAHLSRGVETIFERLERAGLRTAGTTYLIYRGPVRHAPSGQGLYRRISQAAQFHHAVWGPSDLFYADLFDTRDTGCSSVLGMPGQRDRHSGCVAARLVEDGDTDFLLLSLPDNDTWSHRHGPAAQVHSIAVADQAMQRMTDAAGGVDAFLEEWAVVVISDHSQTPVSDRINLTQVLDRYNVLSPRDSEPGLAELAVCPAGRFAMTYATDPAARPRLAREVAEDLLAVAEIDLVARLDGEEAIVGSELGELRFAPGGDWRDGHGEEWSFEGDRAVLDLDAVDGLVSSESYPEPLGRLWSALTCPTAGEVLVSAAPGNEFTDWGGSDHVGGGSHGSLDAGDSLGVLLFCGLGPDGPGDRDAWTLRDAARVICEHFSVPS